MKRASAAKKVDQPVPGSPKPLVLPEIQKSRLPNGLDLWLVERPRLPLVALHLVLHAGADQDAERLPGLATMTAEALDAGTDAMDALRIAQRLEFLGAVFQSRAVIDGAFVSLLTLSRHLDAALAIAANVLTGPVFPRLEFERRTRQRRGTLLQQNDQPNIIATLAFNRILYGAHHPYGNNPAGTEESMRDMRREHAAEFWETYYRPNNGTLIAVGDISLGDLRSALVRSLNGWNPGEGIQLLKVHPPPARPRRVYLIQKRDAPQSEIRIGCPALSRSSPEVFPALVMNRILGGQFSSRLNANLREKRGLTYGVYSTFQFFKGEGPFVVSAAVASGKTAVAVREIMRECEQMRQQGARPAELEYSKKGLIGGLPLAFETPVQIATALQSLPLYGLPDDYYASYAQKVRAVTLDEVQRVAGRFLDSSAMTTVVVGDAARIRKGLEQLKLGEVVLCDSRGEEAEVPGGGAPVSRS